MEERITENCWSSLQCGVVSLMFNLPEINQNLNRGLVAKQKEVEFIKIELRKMYIGA